LRGSVIAAVVLVAALGAPRADAQVAVDQLEMVFKLQPGNPRLGIINLRNEGATAVQAVVRLEDWDRLEDGTNRWFPSGTVPGSCGPVLDVFPQSVSLEPGASQAVRVTMDSTASLNAECWAAAIVEAVQPRSASGVQNVIRTATKIYIQPPGLEARGEVVGIQVAPAAGGKDSAASLAVTFHNTGQRHLETTGEVQFRRPDNSIAAKVPVQTLYTLPGAKYTRKVRLPSLPSGRYVVLAILDFGGDELAAGQVEYQVPR
jgi:P pilus assembly chaperone PapD